MPPVKKPTAGKEYWRSLDELTGSPEFEKFVRDEFPGMVGEIVDPASRRGFLKFMGASMALAGMTACRWPQEEILPFASRPSGYVPGDRARYATAMELEGVGTGMLVTSADGRPIKIEGNPEHPFSAGGTSAVAQAAVLELYDPDRSGRVVRGKGAQTSTSSWDEFDAFAAELGRRFAGNGGAGLVVLSEAVGSPSLARLRKALLERYPQAAWHEYEALTRDRERLGSELAFGAVYRPVYSLDRAEVIVSFDEDLLLDHPAAVRHTRDFAPGRRADHGEMSRLHVVETGYSLTGANADHRYPLAPSRIPAAVAWLAARVLAGSDFDSALRPFLEHPVGEQLAGSMVEDLLAHPGESLVVAGPRQGPGVHALVHAINAVLGNAGRTVRYISAGEPQQRTDATGLRQITRAASEGRIDTLLILGGNPVYDGAGVAGLRGAVAAIPNTVHLSLHRNETSMACEWHLPRAHFLESWGDTRAWDGTVSVVQPLIRPLFGGRSTIELLATLLGEQPRQGYDIVRETMRGLLGPVDFEARWRRLLHDGLVEQSAWPEAVPALAVGNWSAITENLTPDGADRDEIELAFLPDPSLRDGRFANNGWLQELPEPLSKLAWDNALMISPATAAGLGLGHGDVARVTSDGNVVELPVFIMPGVAAGAATVWLGHGRVDAGRVGNGVGVDVYPMKGADPFLRVSVEGTGGKHVLATTQNHWAIDPLGGEETQARSRVLAREIDVHEFVAHPEAVHHMGPEHSRVDLWKHPGDYEKEHRWAMAIDLSACTGCNACVLACQAENNIPVVGKDETAYGRAMHWIRVDRYFQGEPDSPAVVMQPVTCHHCENAPCEQVCPVGATVHDREGLNVMVYNRCVGTRYCSNNCPYKVRRFNWFNNHKNESEIEQMAHNPEVTVRSRGVMEKCTFCVQRINHAKIQARNDGREVRDGEVTTACEQACPSRAIVFGDLNDETSRVRGMFEHSRSYSMLEEINVRPRTRYLARLRNRSSSEAES